MNESLQCEKAELPNLFGVEFLVLPLVSIMSVTANPQIKQIFSLDGSNHISDQVVNTIASASDVGYNCFKYGGCSSKDIDVSGYYESNGK